MGGSISKTDKQGNSRSPVAQLLDPIGLCIQPVDIENHRNVGHDCSREVQVPTPAPAAAPPVTVEGGPPVDRDDV